MARITIFLEDETEKKLRMLHAKKIMKTKKSVSFSKIVNETLKRNLK